MWKPVESVRCGPMIKLWVTRLYVSIHRNARLVTADIVADIVDNIAKAAE